jgi:hypothetical protein
VGVPLGFPLGLAKLKNVTLQEIMAYLSGKLYFFLQPERLKHRIVNVGGFSECFSKKVTAFTMPRALTC